LKFYGTRSLVNQHLENVMKFKFICCIVTFFSISLLSAEISNNNDAIINAVKEENLLSLKSLIKEGNIDINNVTSPEGDNLLQILLKNFNL
jgi:hypothetical protein